MPKVSLTFEEIGELKRKYLNGAAYSARMSLAFVIRLMQIRQDRGEDRFVIREIDELEHVCSSTSATKGAAQFKRPPLHPLWHKHFSTPRHLMRNIGVRWALDGEGNRDLMQVIGDAATKFGHLPEVWPNYLIHRLVVGGIQDRVEKKRMTGDWIIFAKHEGKNYYLDLATHEEGRNADQLLVKLREGSEAEFPFLFT